MNACIIQLGKTKENWLKEGIQEYLKRLKPYLKIEVIELPDTALNKVANTAAVKEKEAERILKHIQTEDYLILLDERGQQKSSIDFAEFLSSLYIRRRVVFVIGGVYGTDMSLQSRADLLLSLSRMTFTHQHVRLILVEQIYRAMMINSNKPYHY